jgi:hypothetical protein
VVYTFHPLYKYNLDQIWYNNLGCPRVIRADYGTENSITAKIHIAFRMEQERCFFYGPSTANIVGLLPWFTMVLPLSCIHSESSHGGLSGEDFGVIGGLSYAT